jgi:hypothetical protein
MGQKEELQARADELGLDVKRRDGKSGAPTIEDYQHAIGVAEGAIAPDPPPEVETKTFTVAGPFAVAGYGQGQTFEAEVWADGSARIGDERVNMAALVEQGAVAEGESESSSSDDEETEGGEDA